MAGNQERNVAERNASNMVEKRQVDHYQVKTNSRIGDGKIASRAAFNPLPPEILLVHQLSVLAAAYF